MLPTYVQSFESDPFQEWKLNKTQMTQRKNERAREDMQWNKITAPLEVTPCRFEQEC